MASSKLMTSSSASSRNSDLRRTSLTQPEFYNFPNHKDRPKSDEGFLLNAYAASSEAQSASPKSLLREDMAHLDSSGAIAPIGDSVSSSLVKRRTVDDVWREIVAGKATEQLRLRKVECKEEAMDELMTLEDFLVKAGAVDELEPEPEPESEPEPPAAAPVKVEAGRSGGMFGFDNSYVPRQGSVDSALLSYGSNGGGSANGRGKRRASSLLEPMDKAAAQRQRRMIKNRESAARSRERKQQYQVELESMAVKLEEEKEQLLKERAKRMKERRKMLMDKVIPVLEKRRPARIFKRARSIEW